MSWAIQVMEVSGVITGNAGKLGNTGNASDLGNNR